MTSKEMLVEMYNTSISNIGMFEKADRLRECFNKIADDLDILEEIRNEYTVFKNDDDYFLRVGNNLYLITRKQYDKWVRWLNDGK